MSDQVEQGGSGDVLAQPESPVPMHARREVTLCVSPARIVGGLATFSCVLVALGLAGQIARWMFGASGDGFLVQLVDLDSERNLPALWSSLMLVVAMCLLFAMATVERNRRQRAFWIALGVGFGLMAIDEWRSYHERLIAPLREPLGGGEVSPWLFFAWVVPGWLVVAAAGVAFMGFLNRLCGQSRRRFLCAGAVYVSGALGVEMVGAYHYVTFGDGLRQSFIVAAEESLEMAGVLYFVHAVLLHIAARTRGCRISFVR